MAGNRKKPLQIYFLFACARERLYSENEVEKAVGNLCCVILFSWAMTDQTQPQRIYTSAFYPDTVFIQLVGAKPEKTCWKPNATLWKPAILVPDEEMWVLILPSPSRVHVPCLMAFGCDHVSRVWDRRFWGARRFTGILRRSPAARAIVVLGTVVLNHHTGHCQVGFGDLLQSRIVQLRTKG